MVIIFALGDAEDLNRWLDYPSSAELTRMLLGLKLSTRELGFVGVMTALCVASNYLMLSIVNVKFMDLFVFVSGYVMGPFVGILVGIFTWLVYGTLNPYGFSLPILFATIAGESLYGLVGGLASQLQLQESRISSISNVRFWVSNVKFGTLGFLLTFVYDLFTNAISGLLAGLPIIVAIIVGVPFALAHEVSNFLFFFFGASLTINAIQIFTAKRR